MQALIHESEEYRRSARVKFGLVDGYSTRFNQIYLMVTRVDALGLLIDVRTFRRVWKLIVDKLKDALIIPRQHTQLKFSPLTFKQLSVKKTVIFVQI